ncbi:MAG: XRE family transcriptional regulator [Gammaproteobacteria bacterium]|nr:MAG: XRE family transcriptional regulator [Gammaproteobacteria bacterium]
MAQINSLLLTLKKTLKAHGLTYKDLAPSLELSEASVKRLFAEQTISLQRLEQICQLMELEISDLVQMMNEQQPRLQHLSVEQEKEITQDLVLLLITVSVLNRWTLQEIVTFYRLTENDCIQKLARLDKLKIIELLPKNKIKLLVAPNFSWRENGPIQQFFQEKIAAEYFKTKFKEDDECLVVLNGMLSSQSNGEFQRKLKKLAREFDELNNEDVALPFDQRNGVTVVMAIRNWRYGLFSPLLRKV